MPEIIPIKERVTVCSLTLEEYVNKLCQHGKPRFQNFGKDEWYCAVDMFVQSQGIEFKIASGFKEPSMQEAARVCYERLEKALSDLGLSHNKMEENANANAWGS